jgi:PIN domain nuclease of toxin-antitoxin system
VGDGGAGLVCARAARNSGRGSARTSCGPAISIFEIATAVRRKRLELRVSLEQWLRDLRTLLGLRLDPVTAHIAQVAGMLETSLPGDPADRIIVATAIDLKARLVTADARLRQSRQVETVW